jgi:hypothetical protein
VLGVDRNLAQNACRAQGPKVWSGRHLANAWVLVAGANARRPVP